MKVKEIRNLKTSRTKKQINDEISALKSKRNVQLSITDWTQLPDVPVENVEEFRSWRRELRALRIRTEQDLKNLHEVISRKPIPVMGEYPLLCNDIEASSSEIINPPVDMPEDITPIPDALATTLEDLCTVNTREEAEKILYSLLVDEKHVELREADSSSYALFRLLQEELIEHDPQETPPKFLEKYMQNINLSPTVTEDLEIIAEICKNYFSSINEIFFKFEQKIRSVYTMSDEDLKQELDECGYRYRFTD